MVSNDYLSILGSESCVSLNLVKNICNLEAKEMNNKNLSKALTAVNFPENKEVFIGLKPAKIKIINNRSLN